MNVGANLNRRGMDIARVAMPLVRLMREDGLSWSQKEQIADVIRELLNSNDSHKAEQDHLAGRSAGMQQRAADRLARGASMWQSA